MEYFTQIQCMLELIDTCQEEILLSAGSIGRSHEHDILLKTMAVDECDNVPDVPALYP